MQSNDVGSYLRAKVELSGGGFAYTRNLGGRVKNASAATAGSAIAFVSGNASPRVGQKIQASDPRPSGAVDARFSWQRCDNADSAYTDCSYIYGVRWTNYTPVAADVNKYLRMVVYYVRHKRGRTDAPRHRLHRPGSRRIAVSLAPQSLCAPAPLRLDL